MNNEIIQLKINNLINYNKKNKMVKLISHFKILFKMKKINKSKIRLIE